MWSRGWVIQTTTSRAMLATASPFCFIMFISFSSKTSHKQVALLWQRDRATRLSVEILQLQYPYRMALFA